MNLRKRGCALFLCVHSTVRHQKNKLGRRRRVQASTSLMIDGTSRYSLYSQSNPSKNFSVFQTLGAPNLYYRLSRLKGPLGTLPEHPFFGGFCTCRENCVRRRIERFWHEKVGKIVNRRSLQGSTLPPAPPKFNIVEAFPRLARVSLRQAH